MASLVSLSQRDGNFAQHGHGGEVAMPYGRLVRAPSNAIDQPTTEVARVRQA